MIITAILVTSFPGPFPKWREGTSQSTQHVLFPTIYNNCKLCIVLQLIIIVNFKASLRTRQYYWLKNCLLALRARALDKFGEVDTVPVSENSFNNNWLK